MPYYDVYDGGGNLLASGIYIDDGLGGGGPMRADTKALVRLPLKILWLVLHAASIAVLCVMCHITFFRDSESKLIAFASALPMLIAIIVSILLLAGAVYGTVVQWKIIHALNSKTGEERAKIVHKIKHKSIRDYLSENAEKNFSEETEEYNASYEELCGMVRAADARLFCGMLTRVNRAVRILLLAVIFFAVLYQNIPFATTIHEDILLLFVGPLFAYSYLLGILEFVVYYKQGKLKKHGWLSFLISFVAGPIAAALTMLLVYLVQLPFYTEGGYYFSFEGIEVFVILLFMLAALEVGLAVFHKKKG